MITHYGLASLYTPTGITVATYVAPSPGPAIAAFATASTQNSYYDFAQ